MAVDIGITSLCTNVVFNNFCLVHKYPHFIPNIDYVCFTLKKEAYPQNQYPQSTIAMLSQY